MQNFFILIFYLSVASSLEMNDILKELSWPLKLKVFNEISKPDQKIVHEKPRTTVSLVSVLHLRLHYCLTSGKLESILNLKKMEIDKTEASSESVGKLERKTSTHIEDAVTTPEFFSPNDATPNLEPLPTNIEQSNLPVGEDRRVGIQLLRGPERQNAAGDENDDKDMRLKLFRLMYETVRDSDLKVKRAELIKDHYTNSSSFEIGYLIGDITDKNNIITDISMTLKRFHREWKPIEHINAYEQIANQAIEITHLIDLVRVVNKRGNDQK